MSDETKYVSVIDDDKCVVGSVYVIDNTKCVVECVGVIDDTN